MSPRPPAEATALVAMMLLHNARREARLDEAGDVVVLEEQDRGRWDRQLIAEALALVEEAFRGGPGPFALQAAIAALHCRASRFRDTDWPSILGLYDQLERLQPSPIVSLNRAVAVAMVEGPQPALAIIDALAAGDLKNYHLLHAARADLLRRMGPPRKLPAVTGARLRWLRMTASAAFSNGGCANFRSNENLPATWVP